ncbi:hypothetical protein [Kribbella sp. NPDC004536]|uniref:hypothetical protein n=1 Tax=Kribbella sp. NPDC004536 TaxID=3364106 RepID=UPI0036CC6811
MNEEITAVVGLELYSFDGRILEIFGPYPKRYHVAHLRLNLSDPDRKGNRKLQLDTPGVRSTTTITAKQWASSPNLPTLLQAVHTATNQ